MNRKTFCHLGIGMSGCYLVASLAFYFWLETEAWKFWALVGVVDLFAHLAHLFFPKIFVIENILAWSVHNIVIFYKVQAWLEGMNDQKVAAGIVQFVVFFRTMLLMYGISTINGT